MTEFVRSEKPGPALPVAPQARPPVPEQKASAPMKESQNVCAVAKRRPLEWLLHGLFPQAPQPEIAGDERTYLTTNIHVYVGWRDKLRLLLSGHALVQVRTYTDVEVKEAESISVFSVVGSFR